MEHITYSNKIIVLVTMQQGQDMAVEVTIITTITTNVEAIDQNLRMKKKKNRLMR